MQVQTGEKGAFAFAVLSSQGMGLGLWSQVP